MKIKMKLIFNIILGVLSMILIYFIQDYLFFIITFEEHSGYGRMSDTDFFAPEYLWANIVKLIILIFLLGIIYWVFRGKKKSKRLFNITSIIMLLYLFFEMLCQLSNILIGKSLSFIYFEIIISLLIIYALTLLNIKPTLMEE